LITIKIKFGKSKEIRKGQFGRIIREGNKYKLYILDTPDFLSTLAHEFGHIITDQLKDVKDEEELPEILEDATRKWIRKQ